MNKVEIKRENRYALITGATSGIGLATAYLLAKNEINLILCGRRQERLDELSQNLTKANANANANIKIHTLRFDVRDRHAVETQISSLPPEFQHIDILINNAGNAHGLDPIDKGSVEDWEAMIDINVKGLLYVTKAILPQMIARKKGHIINIGSVAGKEAYPNGNVYCASKFAVDALNQGMRMDLLSHGIKVSAIHPGLVETEFSLVRFKGDSAKASKVYDGLTPLSGHDVAELIYFIITRPQHVNIADTIIFPLAQASATLVKREL